MTSFLFRLLVLAALVAGCGQAPQTESTVSAESPPGEPVRSVDQDESKKDEAEAEEGAGGAPAALPAPVQAAPNAPTAGPAATRLIIYHADLRVKVAEMPAATAALEKAVQAAGGWTSGLTETRESGEWRQETTIRVAPARFGDLLKRLGALGTVERRNLSTSDVTAEHADVTARLAAKRALEQEYLRLLKQAKKVSEMLEVEEKLGEVREEIESTEAQLKHLNDEVGFSTITVTLFQPIRLDTPDAPVVSIGARFVEAVYDGWRLIVGLALGAVTVWPLWLLGAGGWWLWKRRKRA